MRPWYSTGLRFSCTGCGRCCTVPGNVWVSETEVEAMAVALDMPRAHFFHLFVRRVDGRWSLTERNGTECVFWHRELGCRVYDSRPQQCRTFPFWQGNLGSAEAWGRAGGECEGIGEGRLYSIGEIRRIVAGGEATADGPAAPIVLPADELIEDER